MVLAMSSLLLVCLSRYVKPTLQERIIRVVGMVINPSCTQIITSYMACKPRILALGQPHLLCQNFLEKRTCVFNSKFLKQIYRSLARVLRKLSCMTLTLELQILRLAISLRNIIHSTRLSLTLTSPYNIY
jgi:hypothetical protein